MLKIKIFVITLPNSKRKSIIENQLLEGGFDFEFTPGISKKDIIIDWENKIFKTEKYQIKLNTSSTPIEPSIFFGESYGSRKWIKMGEIGLFMAHLDLWIKLCNDSTHDAYMILEDDSKFLFTPDDLNRFVNLFDVNSFQLIQNQKISPNFSNGKIGFNNLTNDIELIPVDSNIWQNTEGTATYTISKQAAFNLINFCNTFGIFNPVDNLITRAYSLNYIKVYFPPNYLQAGLNEESAVSEIHVPVEDLGVMDGIVIKG